MTTRPLLASLIASFIFTTPGLAGGNTTPRDDWQAYFDQHEAVGTILIVDHRGEMPTTLVYNQASSMGPVGWVERSDTHRFIIRLRGGGLRFANPPYGLIPHPRSSAFIPVSNACAVFRLGIK